MILSFRCKKTERLFEGESVREFRVFQAQAERKLLLLDAAVQLIDLASPPGNRREPLKGARHGQHSIPINDQWRICFRWTPQGPEGVELVDYH